MLVVADGNMLSAKSVLPVVRNQIDAKILVKSKLLSIEQADDRSNTVLVFGRSDPSIDDRFRHLTTRLLGNSGSWSASEFALNYHLNIWTYLASRFNFRPLVKNVHPCELMERGMSLKKDDLA
jgi:hypothetical protein